MHFSVFTVVVVMVVEALVDAKVRAAMVLADAFDGVTTGSERDMLSAEPSEGAGEEERSSVTRGIRDVMN